MSPNRTRTLILILNLLFIVSSNITRAAELNELQYLTENFPPYNFKESNKLQGIAVDLLIAASEKAESPISLDSIQLQPWARAYRSALTEKNTVLFSTTRTKERDELFKWVGPIASIRMVALAKKSHAVKIKDAKDLKNFEFTAIRDDVGEELLKKAGVPEKNIKLGTNADAIVKKLQADRTKIWVYEENVARWFFKKNGLNSADYEVVHLLSESQIYFTFNKSVDDATVQLLQKGVDLVKNSNDSQGKNQYEAILAKYQ